MRQYTSCYIAFIDLLGFKKYVESHSCDEIAFLFDEINTDYNITVKDNKTPWVSPEIVKMKVMSDTICLYTDASQSDALAKIVAACAYFQVRLLRMQTPILSRGAIVRDNIYTNIDITFGPGVTRAYLLEEQLAVTPRIILENGLKESCYSTLTNQGKDYLDTYLYEDYDYLCVDSLFLFYGLCHEKDSWKDFAKYVITTIDKTSNDNVLNKYKYLYSRFPYITKKYMSYIDAQ